MASAILASPKHQHPSPKHQRPGRSNSLQRMLELEKQSMLHRRNAHTAEPEPASPASPTTPPSHTSTQKIRLTVPRRQLPSGASTSHSLASDATTQQQPLGYKSTMQSRHRQMQHPYELPPINTGASIGTDATNIAVDIFGVANPASSVAVGPQSRQAKAEQSVPMHVSSPVELPNTMHELDLQDRRELCRSPSWDAYNRRKQEKKEKEQADKEAKSKKRRLSKVPPPSPTLKSATPKQQQQQQQPPNKAGPYGPSSRRGLALAQTDACMSDSNLARPRQQKERPASVLGLSSPELPLPQDIPAAQQARGRSSSFSSLFRGRRPSIDQPADTGFIGGIKLENRRLEANQQELNDKAVASDDIAAPRPHADKRSPSPLRIFAPRHELKDKHARAYPPIAIKTSGKNQALLAPESPTAEDGMMAKWRVRMGLKEKKEGRGKGHKLTKSPSAQKEEVKRKALPKSESALVITSPTIIQKIHGPVDDEKMGMLGSVDPSAHPVLSQKPSEPKQARNNHSDEAINSGSEESYNTVPESPPPPPRRSSKRKSLISLGDGTNLPSPQLSSPPGESNKGQKDAAPPAPMRPAPLAPSYTMPALRQKPSHDRVPRPASNRWSMVSDPPSISYESLEPSGKKDRSSKKTLKEAARAALGRNNLPSPKMPAASAEKRPASRSRSPFRGKREHTSAGSVNDINAPRSKPARVLGMQDWRISAPIQHSHPNRSSEDSCSDDMRSPSEHGTPDSSRPQSERGVFPTFGDNDTDGRKARHDSGYTSAYPSPAISHADSRHVSQPSPLELDPVQAAALKVMAAFPDVNPWRPGVDRRTNSDPNIASVKGKQSLQSRDSRRPVPIKTAIEPVHDPESKTPPLRDLLMLRDESSVATPWPATYLEAARKAAPNATAPKASKQNPSSPSLAPAKQNAPSLRTRQTPDTEPIAKMFVECCACKYYHDMPSKLYEFMAHPQDMVTLGDDMHFAGSVSMTVKCPWCKHEMNTKCCAGLAAMVYVKERLH